MSERAIAATTGHKSVTVPRGDIRDGSLFTENAAAAGGTPGGGGHEGRRTTRRYDRPDITWTNTDVRVGGG